ncbi:MAG: hydantoinase/oxoprolinase family protein [Candidatus Hermodarchaeota archaeon]
MIAVAGLDIGGANTKVAICTFDKISKNREMLESKSFFFPFWLKKDSFQEFLKETILPLFHNHDLHTITVTITAELSDCFATKFEGIEYICTSLKQIFSQPIKVLTTSGEFLDPEVAISQWKAVSAANWFATAAIVAENHPNAIFMDIGSTTTDIIPLVSGQVNAKGKTDLERLISGELIYTGILRTNPVSIVHKVLYKGQWIRLSSELFACSGDIHVILDHLSSSEFVTETPDNRGTTKNECFARLARIVCADLNMIEEESLTEIARHIYQKQIDQIVDGLKQVIQEQDLSESSEVVLTGIGARYLGEEAAKKLNMRIDYLPLDEKVSSAVCVAYLYFKQLEASS